MEARELEMKKPPARRRTRRGRIQNMRFMRNERFGLVAGCDGVCLPTMTEFGAEAFDFVHEVEGEAEGGGFEGVGFAEVFDAAEAVEAVVVIESGAAFILRGGG